jgi:peptidoglycan glycosyltransferase
MSRAPRRTTELALLVMVGVVVVAAYVLASLGRLAELPADIVPFFGVILLLLAGAHVATRRLVPASDATLLPLAALLNGFGYVMIARLDDELAGFQAVWTAVGIGAFVLTLLVVQRPRTLDRYRYTLMAAGVIALALPLVPGLGLEIQGAQLWVKVGPIIVQPGEFAKIALGVFFASYLVEKRELLTLSTRRIGGLHLPEPRHLAPLLGAWGVAILVMVAERDLGSSLLFFTLFVTMVYVATGRAAFLLLSLVMFVGAAYVAWRQFGHVQVRVDTWLRPFEDPFGDGFQISQSSFALADGGLTGTGLGLGRPDTIPVVETDFILSAIGEELGLVGVSAVLMTYLLFIGTGLRIALSAPRNFEKLLATGLTALFGFQAFIIVAGITRLLPLTGITLPFVSYGGSSLVANYVLLALMLRISDGGQLTRARSPRADGHPPTLTTGPAPVVRGP